MTTLAAEPSARDYRFQAPRHLGAWTVLILVALIVVTPLSFLVLGSLSSAKLPGDIDIGKLTLANYAKVWLDPNTYDVVFNTVIFVLGSTLFAMVLATSLAWLVERSDLPGRNWIFAAIPMTLVMPGMLQAMAYVLLFSPRIGFINNLLAPLGIGPFNVYSMSGMILLEGLRLVPSAFLVMVPLLRSMDPSLEEAAATSGAHPLSTLRRITLRLMAPGLLAIAIYQGMTAFEAFEIPAILGAPGQVYVFSTRIYSIINAHDGIPNYGEANALAIVYVVIGLVATLLYGRVIARSERYSIITGKGYRPRTFELGSWRWPIFALVMLFLLFSIILPFIVLVYISFLPFVQQPSPEAFATMSLANYSDLWEGPRTLRMLNNTLLMVVAASTLTVIVSFAISSVVVRSKFGGRKVLDQLAFLPHAIPGIVMGIAFLWLFLQGRRLGIDLFGTVWSIALAFTVGFMAYGTRSMNAAMLQIHKDLEEAAQMSGASYWLTVWRVSMPLMMPTLIGVWIWAMLHAVRQVGHPLLLTEGSENEVLAVFVWRLWNEGQIGAVGAIGSIMVVVLLLVTVGLRFVGFRRGSAMQT